MKTFLSIALCLFIAQNASAQTHAAVNFEKYFRDQIKIINLNTKKSDWDDSQFAGLPDDVKNRLKHEMDEKEGGYFKDKDDSKKAFYTQVVKAGGKVTRIMQGRKNPGDDGLMTYQTVKVADDGSATQYTYCDINKSKPDESLCQTVNAKICGALEKEKLTSQELNDDLIRCAKLDNQLKKALTIINGNDYQTAQSEDLSALNGSQVQSYYALSPGKKKIDAKDYEKNDRLGLMQDVLLMGAACRAIKAGGFGDEVTGKDAVKNHFLPEELKPVDPKAAEKAKQ